MARKKNPARKETERKSPSQRLRERADAYDAAVAKLESVMERAAATPRREAVFVVVTDQCV